MFCTNCGANIDNGSLFCTNCGTPLASAAAQQAPMQKQVRQEPVVQQAQPTPYQQTPYQQPVQQDAYQPPSYDSPAQQNAYQEPSYGQPSSQQPGYQQQGSPYQQPYAAQPYAPQKSKVAAGLLGIFLGAFGAHKFYLGYTKTAIIMLVITLVGSIVVIGPFAMGVIGFIEGILYLVKSDQEFYDVYVAGQKDWF